MESLYNPAICDLCGSDDYSILIQLTNDRAMRSDRDVVECSLCKLICTRCGLVRSGHFFAARQLQHYYADEYVLSIQPEHYFFTPMGQISRSEILCDWIISSMGMNHWRKAKRCLEIGAGSGALMQEFIKRFPDKIFEGLELNKAAVSLAQSRDLRVYQGALSDLDTGQYDIIYTVAVIEHVPSPTKFLYEIHKRLRRGGSFFLCQPTQDVASYDVFFVDHLHHFGTEHLRQYARKSGFHEQGLVVGHQWMPNFSLHLWEAVEKADNFAWIGSPGYTTCVSTARDIAADMTRLNATLARLKMEQRRVAVFGLNEVYWLAVAYSTLSQFPIICGLDDTPDKSEYKRLGFPVLTPEDGLLFRIQDVILTMNKIYYKQARERVEKLGFTVHQVLS